MERWSLPPWSADNDEHVMSLISWFWSNDDLYLHNSSTILKVRQPKTGRIIPMVQPGMGSMQTSRIPFRLHDNHDHDSKMLMNTELICSAEVAWQWQSGSWQIDHGSKIMVNWSRRWDNDDATAVSEKPRLASVNTALLFGLAGILVAIVVCCKWWWCNGCFWQLMIIRHSTIILLLWGYDDDNLMVIQYLSCVIHIVYPTRWHDNQMTLCVDIISTFLEYHWYPSHLLGFFFPGRRDPRGPSSPSNTSLL